MHTSYMRRKRPEHVAALLPAHTGREHASRVSYEATQGVRVRSSARDRKRGGGARQRRTVRDLSIVLNLPRKRRISAGAGRRTSRAPPPQHADNGADNLFQIQDVLQSEDAAVPSAIYVRSNQYTYVLRAHAQQGGSRQVVCARRCSGTAWAQACSNRWQAGSRSQEGSAR